MPGNAAAAAGGAAARVSSSSVRWAGRAWPDSDESDPTVATTSSELPGRVNALASVTPMTAMRTIVCVPQRGLRRGSLVTKRAIDDLLEYPPRRWRGSHDQ